MQQHHPPKAKLFQHGRSQAVRLPKEFRFEGTEVFVRKVGDDVILSARAKPSMRVLIEALDEFDDSIRLLERDQPTEVDRRESFERKGRR